MKRKQTTGSMTVLDVDDISTGVYILLFKEDGETPKTAKLLIHRG